MVKIYSIMVFNKQKGVLILILKNNIERKLHLEEYLWSLVNKRGAEVFFPQFVSERLPPPFLGGRVDVSPSSILSSHLAFPTGVGLLIHIFLCPKIDSSGGGVNFEVPPLNGWTEVYPHQLWRCSYFLQIFLYPIIYNLRR